jgi:hypothetical protein
LIAFDVTPRYIAAMATHTPVHNAVRHAFPVTPSFAQLREAMAAQVAIADQIRAEAAQQPARIGITVESAPCAQPESEVMRTMRALASATSEAHDPHFGAVADAIHPGSTTKYGPRKAARIAALALAAQASNPLADTTARHGAIAALYGQGIPQRGEIPQRFLELAHRAVLDHDARLAMTSGDIAI